MDDDFEFPYIKNNPELAIYYLKLEKELVNRANYIFFSSKYLSNKVNKRSPYNSDKIEIVNNAIELPNFNQSIALPYEIQIKLKIIKSNHPCLLYIGTISQWFDFDIFDEIFRCYPKLRLVLIGPSEVDIPQCDNIIYLGIIERKYIFSFMESVDALCMPFKVTELIRSVNPVKLYEYIYSGKPVIAPFYEETEPFSDYIYLYDNDKSFMSLCKVIANGNLNAKKNKEESMTFVESNTWDKRIEVIEKHLWLRKK